MSGPVEADYVVSTPPGLVPVLAAPVRPPRDDYAWTHGAAVEGFFVLLTVIVVPVAIVRWTRRLSPVVRAWRRGALKA